MRHELFTYDSDDRLAERVVPFLHEGLAADEACMVVTTRERGAVVRAGLGGAAGSVAFLDRDEHYTRPEAVLAAYDATVRSVLRSGVAGVRVMGELPICQSRGEWDAWLSYEAMLNRAFADRPVWILCGYDSAAVPADVVELACRAHPLITAAQDRDHVHDGYEAPEQMVRELRAPPISAPRLAALPLESDPRRFREALADALASADVGGERADRMLIAAGEAFVNAQRHGGGLRSIRVGSMADRFVCELTDHGRGIEDPLVGYIPPKVGADGGVGLWVARQLTWRLELIPVADGLAVRLWV
jgi:anti-sigma regulatory factor (Ser/Thr protein kinase)